MSAHTVNNNNTGAPEFDFNAFINSPMPLPDVTASDGGIEFSTFGQGLSGQDAGSHPHIQPSSVNGAPMQGAPSSGFMPDLMQSAPLQHQGMGQTDSNWMYAQNPATQDTHGKLDTPMASPPQASPGASQIDDGAMSYSARIAAHHSHLLDTVLPGAPPLPAGFVGPPSINLSKGLPGQRSLGGSVSSSAVPLSRAVHRALSSTEPVVTLQERRRNARRAQQARKELQQPSSMSTPAVPTVSSQTKNARQNAAQTSAPVSGISTSGRNAKRGMTTSSGRIHSPQTTVDARVNHPVPATAASAMSPPGPQAVSSAVAHKAGSQRQQPYDNAASASRHAYSSTGFDLLGALARVVLRPNPRIVLGPVDLSCSFTVCDARHPEQPIIYCTDTFCKLTGYSRQEVLGRNCRFLQSPDGRVQKGSERFHTDNAAVAHLKQHSHSLQECQASLINYRKNGSPFINLVTVVPIGWGDSPDPVYLVGFQVDLVEQPSAVLERAEDGSYVVNYSSGGGAGITVPASAVEHIAPGLTRDLNQEAAIREVSIGRELTRLLGGEKGDAGQWARILLQNSHDLIHVISLKGTFLYVSPSVERLLGWKPEELVGKSIADVCHPSDVVPVFRELKDSTSNANINAAAKRSFRIDGNANRATKGGVGQGGPEVNLLMRMRHRDSSHMWIESKGKLHLEQGKGRKVVISSGRPRPVYDMPWEPVKATLGEVGQGSAPNFWAKVSSDGLFLSASEGVSSVIDGVEQAQIYGRHLTQMVNKEAMPAMLEALRGVNVSSVTHQLTNAVEEPVWVTSTFFPSAVMPGAHLIPTVFVHIALSPQGSHDRSSARANKVVEKQQQAAQTGARVAAAADEGFDANMVAPSSSVFGELSTQRSSSHLFELHSLKHVNRRLREEVRAAQQRVGTNAVLPASQLPTAADSKNADTLAQPSAPLKEGFVNALNDRNARRLAPHRPASSSMSSSTPNGGNTSSEPTSSGKEGGSSTDDTANTTAISSGNNSDSNTTDSSGAEQAKKKAAALAA